MRRIRPTSGVADVLAVYRRDPGDPAVLGSTSIAVWSDHWDLDDAYLQANVGGHRTPESYRTIVLFRSGHIGMIEFGAEERGLAWLGLREV